MRHFSQTKRKMQTEIQNHEKIYEKLSLILKIKFKTQLKGTEIYFKSLFQMTNLISNEEHFLVILNEKKNILFSNNKEFYEEMIRIIKLNIDDLNYEYEELQNRSQNDAIIDEYQMFIRHEHIGYCGERLSKFLTKMYQLLEAEK